MENRALLHANFAHLKDQGVPLLGSRQEASESSGRELGNAIL